MQFTKIQNSVQAYANLTECLTGTFKLTDRDARTKPLNRDSPGSIGTYGMPIYNNS